MNTFKMRCPVCGKIIEVVDYPRLGEQKKSLFIYCPYCDYAEVSYYECLIHSKNILKNHQ